jgi:hypothetical protein
MSKETGIPLVVVPSSPPSEGADHSATSTVSSTSVSPWSITLTGNDWTGQGPGRVSGVA